MEEVVGQKKAVLEREEIEKECGVGKRRWWQRRKGQRWTAKLVSKNKMVKKKMVVERKAVVQKKVVVAERK